MTSNNRKAAPLTVIRDEELTSVAGGYFFFNVSRDGVSFGWRRSPPKPEAADLSGIKTSSEELGPTVR